MSLLRKLLFNAYLDCMINFSKLEVLVLLCGGKASESQKHDDVMMIIYTLSSIYIILEIRMYMYVEGE